MLVYRTDGDVRETGRALEDLSRSAEALDARYDFEMALSLFIGIGELEAGIADALFPAGDGVHPLAAVMRSAAVQSARMLLDADGGHAAGLHRQLDAVRAGDVPATVEVGVPEGYAFYGLHPEAYAAAAVEFARECRPQSAVCIGIRSIGSSLSAMVAAALERERVSVRSHTVRPHGHPFDRQIVLGDDLRAELLRDPEAWFLVIDEGPGLSGSSFASVVAALTRIGIPDARIVLIPSWNPDGSAFKSESARATWRRHRRYSVNGSGIGFSPLDAAHARAERSLDLSAGAWRHHLLPPEYEWPAAHPQHERQKVWLRDRGEIVRFAGLGAYGVARHERAGALADAGLGPAPRWLARGYLALPFIDGRPCRRDDVSATLINAVADHVAFVGRAFPARRRPDVDALIEMAVTNVREAFGRAPDLRRHRAPLDHAPAAAIDGRMLAHEWLETPDGYVKCDALDHHADHFFPGAQDVAWDLAAASIEFGLGPDGEERLVARYGARSGDRDLKARMAFYRVAYPAFRLGYCTIARDSLGTSADGLRFARDAERYRRALTPSVP